MLRNTTYHYLQWMLDQRALHPDMRRFYAPPPNLTGDACVEINVVCTLLRAIDDFALFGTFDHRALHEFCLAQIAEREAAELNERLDAVEAVSAAYRTKPQS